MTIPASSHSRISEPLLLNDEALVRVEKPAVPREQHTKEAGGQENGSPATPSGSSSLLQRVVDLQAAVNQYLMTDIGSGTIFGLHKDTFQVRHALNVHKFFCAPAVLAMMYVGGFSLGGSPTGTLYLLMHGTYGYAWLLKDRYFPDASWEARATAGSFVFMVVGLCSVCWVAPFVCFLGDQLKLEEVSSPSSSVVVNDIPGEGGVSPQESQELSPLALCATFSLWLTGMVFHFGADFHKHRILHIENRRGLITQGLFSIVRNPNYLGEVFIYSGFSLCAIRCHLWALPWLANLFLWIQLFLPNMVRKDRRLSRHPGWEAYCATTGMIVPLPQQWMRWARQFWRFVVAGAGFVLDLLVVRHVWDPQHDSSNSSFAEEAMKTSQVGGQHEATGLPCFESSSHGSLSSYKRLASAPEPLAAQNSAGRGGGRDL